MSSSCLQAFLLYTVDKIVASLIKQVRSLFISSGTASKFRLDLFFSQGTNSCIRQQVPGTVAVPQTLSM